MGTVERDKMRENQRLYQLRNAQQKTNGGETGPFSQGGDSFEASQDITKRSEKHLFEPEP